MRHIVKFFIELVVRGLGRLSNFSFPETFIWKWKLEYLFGTYEIETTRFFKKNVKKGMTVVDVGANIGYFTKLLATLVGPAGKVVAFEADVENFEILKKNVGHLQNVEIHNIAIADYVGSIDFFHIPGATGTHSLVSVDSADKRTVACVSLDEYFKDTTFPTFIKIDVEGAEKQVFRGMEKGLLEGGVTVVFEYQPVSNKDLVKELLAKHTVMSIAKDGTLQDLKKVVFRKGKVQYANLCLTSK